MTDLFISFEGIDACGKTTQAVRLKNRFEDYGYRVVLVREPGGTNISEKIRQILLSPNYREMDPVTESILLAASRSQLTKELIIPSIEEGKIVICDRYVDSTLAYQGYGRGLDLKWLHELNRVATYELVPYITFLIDISTKEFIRRKGRKKLDRMELAGVEFQKRVRNGYLTLADENDRFIVLNGKLSKDELENQIWKYIKDMIEEYK